LLTVLLAAEAIVTVGYGVLSLARWNRRRRQSSEDRLAVLNHLLPPIKWPSYLSDNVVGVLGLLSLITFFVYVALSIAGFILTTPQSFFGPPWDAATFPLFVASEVSLGVFVICAILLRPFTRREKRLQERIRAETELR
jgi:hypothetical protein